MCIILLDMDSHYTTIAAISINKSEIVKKIKILTYVIVIDNSGRRSIIV